MKIHSALRKTETEKSDFKEEKSETNYTSDQVHGESEIEGEVELTGAIPGFLSRGVNKQHKLYKR